MSEITRASGDMSMDQETQERVLDLTKELVAEFQQATQIVGFFQKEDEIKSVKKKIRRAILDQPFGSRELIQAVSDRFLELGKVRFK
jgi:type I restriction enzyme R subunit